MEVSFGNIAVDVASGNRRTTWSAWRSGSRRVRVDRQKLIKSARVQIRGRYRGRFGQLAFHTHRALQRIGSVQVRADFVNIRRTGSWGATAGEIGQRDIGARETRWIVDDELLLPLRSTVQALGLQDLAGSKAIVEDAVAASNNHLRSRVAPAHSPGKTQTGSPVPMVVNIVLRLEAKARA